MDELTEFERRFEDRLRIFALTGVRPVDSAAVAHAVAVGQPYSPEAGPSVRWRGPGFDRSAWKFAVALGLLVALLGGALLVGARLLLPPPLKEPPTVTNGWVAFSVAQEDPTGAAPDTDIWFAALGQEPRRVVGTDTDGIDQACPAFSPDGHSLAYGEGIRDIADGAAQLAAFRTALVIADVADDGTVAERHTIDVGEGRRPPCPVWSPDGDRLAFGVPRTSPINPDRSGEGSEVWVVRLADDEISVIPDVLATDLDWSPDGSVLAIAGGVGIESGALKDSRIHLYEPATGTRRTLDDTIGVVHLAWSPDGGRIAYDGRGAQPASPAAYDSRGGLRVIDVETGRPEILADAYRAVHGVGPVWSPNGETIAYQRVVGCCESHEVVLVTPDDRSEQTGRPSEIVMPIERTTKDGSSLNLYPWRVTWSPDGTYLLYVAWTYPPEGSEQTVVVAVPTEPDKPATVLAGVGGIVPYDFNDGAMRVPFQVWQRLVGHSR